MKKKSIIYSDLSKRKEDILPEKTYSILPDIQTPSSWHFTFTDPPSKIICTSSFVKFNLFAENATAQADDPEAIVIPLPLSQTFTLIVLSSITSAI